MKKRNILIVLLIALPIFSTIGLATCNAQIVSWNYVPLEATAGATVTVSAVVQFTEGWLEQCNFLTEAGIVPQDVPYSLLPIFGTVYPHAKCCVGNSNYDDTKYVMDQCWWAIPFTNCVETKNFTLTLNAPTSSSFDHCTPDCSAEPARCQPGFYWRGDNYYTISLSTWSACWSEDPNHAHYDGQQSLIHIKSGSGYCGDGTCNAGETHDTCPQDCPLGCPPICPCTGGWWNCPVIWILKGSDVTIIGIIGAIVIGGIIVLRRKKK